MHSFSKCNFLSPILVIACALIIANAAAYSAFAMENGLVDPTRPSGYSERAASAESTSAKLTLTLVRLGTEPHAVINGKTVAPGESIAGYRLLSLQTTSAILSGPNGRTVLQLAPTIRKSAAAPSTSSSTFSVQNR